MSRIDTDHALAVLRRTVALLERRRARFGEGVEVSVARALEEVRAARQGLEAGDLSPDRATAAAERAFKAAVGGEGWPEAAERRRAGPGRSGPRRHLVPAEARAAYRVDEDHGALCLDGLIDGCRVELRREHSSWLVRVWAGSGRPEVFSFGGELERALAEVPRLVARAAAPGPPERRRAEGNARPARLDGRRRRAHRRP